MTASHDNTAAEEVAPSISKALVPAGTAVGTYRLAAKGLPGDALPARKAQQPASIARLLAPSSPAVQAARIVAENSLIIERNVSILKGINVIGRSPGIERAAELVVRANYPRVADLVKPMVNSGLFSKPWFSELVTSFPLTPPAIDWLSRPLPLLDLGLQVRSLLRDVFTPQWLRLDAIERIRRQWLLTAAARTRKLVLTEPANTPRVKAAVSQLVYGYVGLH